MDLQTLLRALVTVLAFVCFVGICIWAYSSRARKGMDEAAQLPFLDDDKPDSGDKQS
ncbi:cbb3-type cytochrome c oxidase subunit 3 [Chitiniphilus purpureus]|uniref:Cbb3-type cytochrome c oxidase subunit 3 n=1 Tax=Chitiniphilus purpureus TaxID=2981137 RepID=A0ABY6DI06_9NEIS|nr:cbb3-type cytochrome c oxidase subunit 3 [Chitiniphilus sp. CD1]UXY13980.1 cbb3-type cytochrome c oxidase subunit 3 [Chitiniphilus sp. CD1]